MIKSGLSDWKEEIQKMSEDKKELKKPDKVIDIVEKILDFSN